ncbi:MAG: hypothetical protein WC443_10020 [Desulfobaccales bacterium]
MPLKLQRLGISAALALFLMGGNGWAAPPLEQPPLTNYMRSVVGTPDELSPLAPAEATKVRKVENRWTCEIQGQPMVYNEGTLRWEPQRQESQTK